MSQITFAANQNGSGIFTIQSPVSNTNRTITLPDAAGNVLLDSQIASQAEAQEGAINTKVMSPLRVDQQIGQANAAPVKIALNSSGAAPIYACRAWVNFNGTGTIGAAQTIRGSGNVTSVIKNATGEYTINFTTAMQDANYSIVVSSRRTTTNSTGYGTISQASLPAAESVRVASVVENGIVSDSDIITVAIFR